MLLRAAVRIKRLCQQFIPVTVTASPLSYTKHTNYSIFSLGNSSHVNPVYSCLSYQIQQFHTTLNNQHGEYEWKDPESEADVVMITVYNKEGKEDRVRGKVGDNMLYLCKRFDVDMEGACEASLACTTCHVYVDHEFLTLLPQASETEEDLLDQAPFLRENSRLGCQIILTKEYEGMVLRLPAATKNFYVDGHKPSHH